MTLPPETLDKIFEHIPTNGKGRQTLTACALVATWWVGPSQRRLFSSVSIYERNYKRWMESVVLSGPNAHLLGYARSLWHCHVLDPMADHKYPMRDLPQDSGKYLSTLCNIHSLTLFNARVEHISEDLFHTCFSAFRGTLTYLSLESFATSFSAFVILVDYFPNITTLRFTSFALGPDEGPVPPCLPRSGPMLGVLRSVRQVGSGVRRGGDRLPLGHGGEVFPNKHENRQISEVWRSA